MPSNSEVFIINAQTLLFFKHTISPPALVVVQLPNMYKALYTVQGSKKCKSELFWGDSKIFYCKIIYTGIAQIFKTTIGSRMFSKAKHTHIQLCKCKYLYFTYPQPSLITEICKINSYISLILLIKHSPLHWEGHILLLLSICSKRKITRSISQCNSLYSSAAFIIKAPFQSGNIFIIRHPEMD